MMMEMMTMKTLYICSLIALAMIVFFYFLRKFVDKADANTKKISNKIPEKRLVVNDLEVAMNTTTIFKPTSFKQELEEEIERQSIKDTKTKETQTENDRLLRERLVREGSRNAHRVREQSYTESVPSPITSVSLGSMSYADSSPSCGSNSSDSSSSSSSYDSGSSGGCD